MKATITKQVKTAWGEIHHISIDGVLSIHPKTYFDSRGYFRETFNWWALNEAGFLNFEIPFVQDNESFSHRGVLRGLHFQKGDDAQAKLVRVAHGGVLDVVVDLRPNSPTFLDWFSLYLNDADGNMLYVPKGCAHGFLAVKDSVFVYKCDNYYKATSCGGIAWNDPTINIDWQLEDYKISEPVLDSKDKAWTMVTELGADPAEFVKMDT